MMFSRVRSPWQSVGGTSTASSVSTTSCNSRYTARSLVSAGVRLFVSFATRPCSAAASDGLAGGARGAWLRAHRKNSVSLSARLVIALERRAPEIAHGIETAHMLHVEVIEAADLSFAKKVGDTQRAISRCGEPRLPLRLPRRRAFPPGVEAAFRTIQCSRSNVTSPTSAPEIPGSRRRPCACSHTGERRSSSSIHHASTLVVDGRGRTNIEHCHTPARAAVTPDIRILEDQTRGGLDSEKRRPR